VEAPHRGFKLREVESVEIISLADNYVNVLLSFQRGEVKGFREWAGKPFAPLMAEHGFSMLIRVLNDGKPHSVLLDTGSSPNGVLTNAKTMGIRLEEVECIVLSHGHYDHCSGLPAIAKAIGRSGLPVIVHEDMFKVRGVASADGTVRELPPFPAEEEVKPARYVRARQPYLVADDLILVTGEIPRRTSFEMGFPSHRALVDGRWQPDPWIWDDRAVVINVKRKGLVVVSGCAHAGIINTVLYAQQLTGTEAVYAILGGLHLEGREGEPRIGPTVEELKKVGLKLVAPSHCTGWRGICAIARALPEAFVPNSVGNLYVL